MMFAGGASHLDYGRLLISLHDNRLLCFTANTNRMVFSTHRTARSSFVVGPPRALFIFGVALLVGVDPGL